MVYHKGAKAPRVGKTVSIYRRPLFIKRGFGLIPMYKGQLIQKGYGLGGIFSGLLRFLKPVLKKGMKTLTKVGKDFIRSDAVKSLGKDVTQSLKKSGKTIVADLVEGKDFKESLNEQLSEQKNMLEKQIAKLRSAGADAIRGGSFNDNNNRKRSGKTYRNTLSKKPRKKKTTNASTLFKKRRDIFST
jgi:cell division protein FtsB